MSRKLLRTLCLVLTSTFVLSLGTAPFPQQLSAKSLDSGRSAVAQQTEPIEGLTIDISGSFFVNAELTFTATVQRGTNVVYEWDFGDGTSAVGQIVPHRYGAAGVYEVELTARNSVSRVTLTRRITIEIRPSAPPDIFHVGTQTVKSRITFVDRRDRSGENVVLLWDFGDGSRPKESSTPSDQYRVTHNYQRAGTFVVTALVYNRPRSPSDRPVASASKPIVITDRPITGWKIFPQVMTRPASRIVLTPIRFRAEALNGTEVWYEWDFDDDSPIVRTQDTEVEHVFAQPGDYEVTVRATNSVSDLESPLEGAITLRVLAEPIGLVRYFCTTEEGDPKTVRCAAYVTQGEPATFQWTFGDGSAPVNGQLVRHTYENPGLYAIQVAATNAHPTRNYSRIEDALRVEEVSSASPRITKPFVAVPGGEVNLGLTRTVEGASCYEWHFGDGKSTECITETTVEYVYERGGLYAIEIIAKDDAMREIGRVSGALLVNQMIQLPLFFSDR